MALRKLVFHAAKTLAADPRVQAKAAAILRYEVVPRAEAAWRAANRRMKAAGEELRDISRDTDPIERAGAFAAKVRDRVIKGKR
jgi:hypothetical protein